MGAGLKVQGRAQGAARGKSSPRPEPCPSPWGLMGKMLGESFESFLLLILTSPCDLGLSIPTYRGKGREKADKQIALFTTAGPPMFRVASGPATQLDR